MVPVKLGKCIVRAMAYVANVANTINISSENLPEVPGEANSIYLSCKCLQATVE